MKCNDRATDRFCGPRAPQGAKGDSASRQSFGGAPAGAPPPQPSTSYYPSIPPEFYQPTPGAPPPGQYGPPPAQGYAYYPGPPQPPPPIGGPSVFGYPALLNDDTLTVHGEGGAPRSWGCRSVSSVRALPLHVRVRRPGEGAHRRAAGQPPALLWALLPTPLAGRRVPAALLPQQLARQVRVTSLGSLGERSVGPALTGAPCCCCRCYRAGAWPAPMRWPSSCSSSSASCCPCCWSAGTEHALLCTLCGGGVVLQVARG